MASSEEFPLRQSSGKLQDNTNMLSPSFGKQSGEDVTIPS